MKRLADCAGSGVPPALTRAAATIFIFHATTCVAAAPLECPASIPEKSIRVVDTAPGWTAFTGSPLYLHGAAPTNGPPENLGELSDYKETQKGNERSYTYQLDGKFSDGKWLACRYGESDQVTLSRRIEDAVQACTFKYRKGKHVGQNDIAIFCR